MGVGSGYGGRAERQRDTILIKPVQVIGGSYAAARKRKLVEETDAASTCENRWRRWTEEEDDFLRKNYKQLGIKETAINLDRSYYAVKSRYDVIVGKKSNRKDRLKMLDMETKKAREFYKRSKRKRRLERINEKTQNLRPT